MRTWIIGALVMALSACQPIPPPKPPPAAQAAPVPVIHGRAFYLERIAVPPGSTLDVQLIDESEASATIAHRQFGDLHGPPFDFDLPYDATRIQSGARYSLRASLRDGDGHLWFTTAARVPLQPGDAQRIEFRLVRAGTR